MLQEYVQWLMEDQCKKLLNMSDVQLAAVMGVSRPTLYIYRKDYSKVTVGKVDLLEEHLKTTKASILLTEE